MHVPIIIGLIQNTSILLVFGMLYDYIWVRNEGSNTLLTKLFTGIILGGFAIVLILTPWTLLPGLVFDTRSVILSVAGLFWGPVPTLTGMLIAVICRSILGGKGVWMGIAVIVSSGTIGILWGYFRKGWQDGKYYRELLLMGFLVHGVMLACTLFLPPAMILPTLKTITFPIMIIYPAGTVLLGGLMIKRVKNLQIRNELALSEERWNFALEGAEDGVWDWNPTTDEIFYSTRYKSMLGYTDTELENRIEIWEKLVHPEDLQRARDDLQKYMTGEHPVYSCIYRVRCKDGTYKWILDRGKIMQKDFHGKPIRFIGTHTDMTERKKVEDELSMARDKAEESDRLKMSFLNNISHEIRTPMNAIVGFSNLLDEELTELERDRFIRIINSNAGQLLGIINDVIELSRLESETIICDSSPFSVNELFDDLFHTMKPIADEKNLGIRVIPFGEVNNHKCFGDQNRIRQILTCFISNAVKYSWSGEIAIGAVTVNEGIRFFVRDNGIGIEPEYREKIFERFYRTPAAQQKAVRGTGLGLSIALQLATIMGGKIGVNPNKPQGSEFFLLLPLPVLESPPILKVIPGHSADLSKYNILIAEDEDANFEFLNVVLGRKVKKVYRAVNGREVLEQCRSFMPDIILMDLKMPVMDGYEATRLVKEIYPDLPVIALSAYSQPEEIVRASQAGCVDFLIKPVQKELLIDIINRTLRS